MDDDDAVDMVVAEHRRLETAAVEPGALLDRDGALTTGNASRADLLQGEIADLMRQRDDIKMWATADGK